MVIELSEPEAVIVEKDVNKFEQGKTMFDKRIRLLRWQVKYPGRTHPRPPDYSRRVDFDK